MRRALLAATALLAVSLVLLAPGSAPFVTVFFLCAGYVAVAASRSGMPLSPDRLARSGLLLVIAVGVLVPALIGLVQASAILLDALTLGQLPEARQDLPLVAAALIAIVAAARRWPGRWADWIFLVVLALVVTALKLAYIHLVAMEPFSDFSSMWEVTSRIADKGLTSVSQESSAFYFRVYVERVLPYLLPLRLLFGPEPSSYAVANVLTGTISSFMVYLLTRKWFGRVAARIAFGVSLVAVETWLAAEIPTHDIPGALYTMLGLVLFVKTYELFARERYGAAVVAAVSLGAVAVLIDLQRTTGGLFLLSCGTLGVLASLVDDEGAPGAPLRRRSVRRILAAACVLLLVPVAVSALIDGGLDAAGLTVPPESYDEWRGLFIASGSESWSNGTWEHFEYEYRLRYSYIPVDWERLSAARLVSDTHFTPLARLSGFLGKVRRLFDLGSQTHFYINGAELAGLGTIDDRQLGRIQVVCRCFNVFFLVGLLLGCRELLKTQRAPLLSFAPLFYLAIVSTSLLLFALIQPRYLFQIWYVGAIYVGIGFERAPRGT